MIRQSLSLLIPFLFASTCIHHVVNSFTINPSFTNTINTIQKHRCSTLFLSTPNNNNNNEDDKIKGSMSFDDATQAIRDEEDGVRMQARGMAVDEDAKRFESKKSSYEEMRAKIRSRASDLNMEKSVATQEAIKAATAKAMAGEKSSSTSTDSDSLIAVDLSKVGGDLLDNPEDELTEEQRKEIDKVGQLNLWEQAMHEFQNTKFPTVGATLKQASLMLLIFIVTASIILKVDEVLRVQYTEWGFIPRSGEVLDYSDLTLPEGFMDQMNEEDLANM